MADEIKYPGQSPKEKLDAIREEMQNAIYAYREARCNYRTWMQNVSVVGKMMHRKVNHSSPVFDQFEYNREDDTVTVSGYVPYEPGDSESVEYTFPFYWFDLTHDLLDTEIDKWAKQYREEERKRLEAEAEAELEAEERAELARLKAKYEPEGK